MFSRILTNTAKHIRRSGWIGWASVSVMTLAFLVSSIFAGLAYVSNLYIQFIERRSNLIVFFEVGMDQEVINELQAKWREVPEIKSIGFTTETEAYDLYADYSARVLPETYAVLKEQDEKKLNSSLDIQLYSLGDFERVESILQKDIESKLQELIVVELGSEESSTEDSQTEKNPVSYTVDVNQPPQYKYSKDPTEPPIVLAVDSDSIEGQREAFTWLRIAGVVVISMLFVVVFFFTFMTVEFRLYNQMEEIGVMQLVGGSLFFIRSPYILEGGFYGLFGAFMSSSILGGLYIAIFKIQRDSNVTRFIYENFSKLPWPEFDIIHITAMLAIILGSGFLLGAVSSYLSIRRYIR